MFFKTDEEKKSAIVTTILFVIMMLIMSIAIFPPEPKELEGGGGGGTIALNFGFDAEGMGDNYTSPDPVATSQPQTEVSKSNDNQILTSESEDAVAIKETPKKDDKKQPVKQPETKPVTNTTPAKPQPNKNVSDAIGNLLGGDGNSNKAGNQGGSNGNLNSQGYDGDGSGGTGTGSGGGNGSGQGLGTGSGYGSGSGGGVGSGNGNWKLDGRKALSIPTAKNYCNEEGVVVVEISVDKTGKVVKAKHTKGGRNDVNCLVDVAIQAALKTKFNSSATARDIQLGTITYNFKLE